MHSCYPSVPNLNDGSVPAAAQRVEPPSSSSVSAPSLEGPTNALQDFDPNVLDELARVLDPGHTQTNERNPSFSQKTSGARKAKPIYHYNSVHVLRVQILRLKRRVRALATHSEMLKDYTVSMLVEKDRDERDLANLRTHYSDELARAKQTRLQLQHAEAELAGLKNRFAEAERFILALVDLGLDPSILRESISSVLRDGRPGEDALISAFQKSSLAKGPSRSKHPSPAADGLRTVGHYLSALDLTINARKELKEKAKVTQFWKMVAKSDPAHADLVTPSPSALDQIQTQSISTSNAPKSSVVDDLVVQLKGAPSEKQSGDNKSGARILNDADPALPEFPPFSCPAEEGRTNVSQHAPPLKAILFATDPEPCSNPASKAPGKEQQPGLSTSPSCPSRDLMAKQSIVAHQSMQSFSAAARRLSDPNLSLKLPFPAQEAAELESSQTSDLDSNFCVGSSTGQSASDTTSDLSALFSPSQRQIKAMSYPHSIPSSISYQNRQMEQLLGRGYDFSTGTFRACQALLSLERICSALTSSSLGSLDGTEEESRDDGPQSSLADSNSTSSAVDDIKGDVLSSDEGGRGREDREFPDNGDIHNNAKDGDSPDQNTSCPTVVKSAPVRKTVKWALPASPDRSSSGSSLSNSSAANTSPTGAFDSSPESDSSSRVRPLAYGKVRPRSSSSPTPAPTRKSAIQAAKSTLSKSSWTLKPNPKVPAKPITKLSSPSKTKRKSSSRPVDSPSSPTAPRSAKVAPRPVIPPRSPLRPTSPTIGQVGSLAPIFKPRGRSASLIPQPSVLQNSEVGSKEVNEDVDETQVKVTSLPQSPRSANIRVYRVYDYTKPVKPLKVVKKTRSEQSPRRASTSSASSSSYKSCVTSMEAVTAAITTGAKVEGEPHYFETTSTSTYSSRLSLASLLCGFSPSFVHSSSATSVITH
ncbi:hypothetical protein EST38_g792 [Candolleomyces aberdarensis]|uniref:Uncharacterized protein n=1 Tax=Candolleomyces aberdarensis TaxID=2316362 RepID=A0A4Q2DX63_9AGAR|nr:hypothetical protein EST38_g792 [Candolleomyces aberdarensis]